MPESIPNCRIIPQNRYETSLVLDHTECVRWNFDSAYPRPFFYPLRGPSGAILTRMGHPGAPNHDHHRSVWFAHESVSGVNFWTDRTEARVRQKQWLIYEDGMDEARMAVELTWHDGHDPAALLTQQLIATIRKPLTETTDKPGEYLLELLSRLIPTADSLEFGKTNFGFLAVRVAASLSAHFGGGNLTNSEGGHGESELFAKPAAWVDYSGPVRPEGRTGREVIEGITYFDHPSNPGFPNHWHVRSDGWMGAAPCLQGPLISRQADPLTFRFALYVHSGPVDATRNAAVGAEFHRRPPLLIARSQKPHQMWQFETERS